MEKGKKYPITNNRKKVFTLNDGDSVRLVEGLTHFENKCCDCGLTHLVLVAWHKNGDVSLKFHREE